MRLVFAGTPDFAAASLSALLDARHEIKLVLTQPDRPSGRGMKYQPSPVKQTALTAGLPVYQPESLKNPESWKPVAEAAPELMIVVAYGLILPEGLLNLPQRGCLNVHASLLPRWRGAAPIHRAILAGDTETGICIMQMDAGLDTGAVIRRCTVPISPRETTLTLHDQLAVAGANLLCETLANSDLSGTPQSPDGVSYAHKISKGEARLDWRLPADTLDRQIRGFNPFPVAHFVWQDTQIRVWAAEPRPLQAPLHRPIPGTVLSVSEGALEVACGEGSLACLRLQGPGGRQMSAQDFLAGHPIPLGACLKHS